LIVTRDDYLDDVGNFFTAHGLPLVAGRLLAYLLVCDPPEQSFAALCTGVSASRASVSTMTRLLAQLGLVERRFGPARSVSFRLAQDAWTSLLEDDLASATQLRDFAKKGLSLVKRPAARSRLTRMHAFYSFLEAETAATLAAWRKRSAR
jgi:DNA-binding transcriptional regulator GbsR (MarR family)